MESNPLHFGDTKVPYGQFYGGTSEEWAGWRGVWRFLADGELSLEERNEIAAYEEALFDDSWRLSPSAQPEFIESEMGPVGAVANL